MNLTQSEWDGLEALDWAETHFDALLTGRRIRRALLCRLETKGLAERVGPVDVCDDDGYVREGCRPRMGWKLMPAGRNALRNRDHQACVSESPEGDEPCDE